MKLLCIALVLLTLVFYTLTTFHIGAQRNKKKSASENRFSRLLQVYPVCGERL
jgi:hypothetical protein